MAEKNRSSVYDVTRRLLIKLSHQLNTSEGKATLARLRHTVGKPIHEARESWPILFEHLPEEFLSQYHEASCEEIAILTVIQIYALHQQGIVSQSVFYENATKYQNIGYSLKLLRQIEDAVAVDRRFNTMITASTVEELVYHLRHLISLLKSRFATTKIDYARLAEDLYWFMRDNQESVRLKWARQYYKRTTKEEENNDN